MNGTLQRTEGEVVSKWAHYADMNPVVKGIDLEQFAAADWLTGFIHEASHGVPHIGIHTAIVTPRELRDRFYLASDRHHHFVNAQGSMAREIMRAHDKIFGVFARAAFISDPTSKVPSVADTLTVSGFAQAWNYSTSLLQPDLVVSLNEARFVPTQEADPPLHDVFEGLFSELRRQYQR
jgi:hypothetical protein